MKPDWFDSGTYYWTPEMGHDYGPWSQEATNRVQQKWWRDPSWGGHIIWNEKWGFQDLREIQDFYINWDMADNPKFHEAMTAAGFQKQTQDVGNWRQWFPDRPVVSHQEKQRTGPNTNPYPGGETTFDWSLVNPNNKKTQDSRDDGTRTDPTEPKPKPDTGWVGDTNPFKPPEPDVGPNLSNTNPWAQDEYYDKGPRL